MSSISKVLYIGVTNDLNRRIYEHKSGTIPGFTKKYNITKLVFFQEFSLVDEAIVTEKTMKAWSRKKKIALVEENNPMFMDLSLPSIG